MRVAPNLLSFHRMSELELPVCRFCHRFSSRRVHRFFSMISKVGDGHYWYLVLASLFTFHGPDAVPAFTHVASVGLICHVLYRSLKNRTARTRPFAFAEAGFDLTVSPLDKYSLPSGHTLHVLAFTVVVTAYFPAMGWILIPFTVLVAASRIVLGLHYPTDVVAGALLGCLLTFLSFQVSSLPI